jgi:hypothetical protein
MFLKKVHASKKISLFLVGYICNATYFMESAVKADIVKAAIFTFLIPACSQRILRDKIPNDCDRQEA